MATLFLTKGARIYNREKQPSLSVMSAWSYKEDSGQDTGVGSLSLLQGIFPTQGSNPGLPHSRLILYQLSHQGRMQRTKSSMPPHGAVLICV